MEKTVIKQFVRNRSLKAEQIVSYLNDMVKNGYRFIGSITVPENSECWASIIIIMEKENVTKFEN
ncbi:hypothetical protein [uncultured Methanobrevibacter sp.]|uniref:hypothetical protein n=1 Tax=uncultured Methanobrevibacter sp. TaxID=253161 RepID=UPI0025D83722|nr:hypothetical protein [uncultured Methanobrevibacter sp.]